MRGKTRQKLRGDWAQSVDKDGVRYFTRVSGSVTALVYMKYPNDKADSGLWAGVIFFEGGKVDQTDDTYRSIAEALYATSRRIKDPRYYGLSTGATLVEFLEAAVKLRQSKRPRA